MPIRRSENMSLEKVSNNLKTLGAMAFTVCLVVIMLAKFLTISGSTTESNAVINAFIDAIGSVGDWAVIIVLGVIAGYLLKSALMGSGKKE
jgi:hypothetical protein